ncbi:hypothetical protein FPQ18DRAFT_296540 [Pyronema domesticum]|uniref:Similar to Probable transport protein YPL264C acc. no. Q08980 n=1 Tax=Pyronema omphalodes (strain CBS 100304) TaxID=1076935 RepID=U4LHD7_PYROM|nr:hypothetical protein FPQ18DRAFT_296540 [Pyronema domesticum]CCX11511.1 Similar to Probable transport protein YPL264C; acc. no. Q08980 [Pyronema omphalodes CBS 100304]
MTSNISPAEQEPLLSDSPSAINTKTPDNNNSSNVSDNTSPAAAAAPVPVSQRYLGSFLILLAEFFVCVMHLITRYLQISLPEERRLHALHLTLIRAFPTVLFCLLYGWAYQRIEYMPFGPRHVRDLLWLRAFGGLVGIICFFAALKDLPLPDATVISFLTPTFVSIACSRISALKEPFTTVEKLSTLMSFTGVILIAQPTFIFGTPPSVGGPARLFAVILQLTGVCGAATSYTAIRWIGPRANTLISMLYFSALVSVFSAVAIVLVPGIPAMQMPRGALEWGLVAGLAFTGFVVQWALTKGLQLEKAGRGLQMMYVQLVFAALFEWAVWGDVMKGWRAVGAVVVLASVAGVQWWKGREKRGDEEVAEEGR